ncbi:MAG: preprotein translocase subunit SecE [Lachnospiraceae bacterium]|nr:preprotein translocase subunit SecE [Lachnospiraceae bacterium]
MGEVTANTTQEKAPKKKSWFKGLKSEFKKIVWPDKETLVKESAAVIVITVILGFVIALVDMAIEYGVNLII